MFDPKDPRTWIKLPPTSAARDAYFDWMYENPYTAHGRVARKLASAKAYRSYVGGLLEVANSDGPASLLTELSQAENKYESLNHAPSYQRLCAWREFLVYIQCSERMGDPAMWRMPLRYEEHQTGYGDVITPTLLGHAIRVLSSRIPPHTLSAISIARAMALIEGKPCTATPEHAARFPGELPGLWSDEARNALAYIIRWGWEAAVYDNDHFGPARDYNAHPVMPALPNVPGQSTGMRPVTVADVASREEPFMLMPTQPPPSAIFYWRDGKLLAHRQPPRRDQEPPLVDELLEVRSERRKGRAMRMAKRTEEKHDAMPDYGAPDTAAAAEAVLTESEEEWNGTKEWKLNVSVAGVRSAGEQPVERVQRVVKTGPGLFDFDVPTIPD